MHPAHNRLSLTLTTILAGLTAIACGDDGKYESSASGATAATAGGSGAATDGNDGGWNDGGTTGTGGEADTEPTTTAATTGGGEELCDANTPVTLYLSPDDSNSMSSPVQAREAVLGGFSSLAGVPLRAWEFFNYYTFNYPPAPKGQIAVTPELYHVEGAPADEFILQIGVTSESITDADRAPMNITLVLDESGSMAGTSMSLLQEACRAIAASLKEGDIVSMVGWDTQNAIKLAGHQVAGADDPTLLARIDELSAGGGTDLHGGLVAGYELAHQFYDPSRINRVVLISDGGANAGVTDIDIIAAGAGANGMDGVYLVGVGVGSASSYNDELMDTVTDVGKGASVFLPDAAEAWKVFHTDFVNTMAVAARDVQVRLDMPPGFEIVRFSGEEFSADPHEIEPQHLAPNDTMVFHQTIRTCAPELVTDEATITVTARYRDAITFETREVARTVSFGELLGVPSPLVRKGAAVMAYTEALRAARAGTADKDQRIAEFTARAGEAFALLPADPDLAEMDAVVDAL